MIKAVFFLLFIQVVLSTNAQNFSFRIFAEDAVGRRDTVRFGFNDSATLQIDPQFGEADIFGTPTDSLDLRVIQRDSLHFNCLQKNLWSSLESNVYFTTTFDAKSNFKPFIDWDPWTVNFEFSIKATDYPVILRSDFSDIKLSFLDHYSAIFLLDTNCGWLPSTVKSITDFSQSDTLFMIQSNKHQTIIASFQHEAAVNEVNGNSLFWKVYPNPAKLHVQLFNSQRFNGWIKVMDIRGATLFFRQIESVESSEIDCTSFERGMYFISYYNDKEHTITVQKLFLQ